VFNQILKKLHFIQEKQWKQSHLMYIFGIDVRFHISKRMLKKGTWPPNIIWGFVITMDLKPTKITPKAFV
jgi:hypothetical protein